jgi:hypothetical protein
MGLWKKSTSADSRPVFLKGDGAEGAGGKLEDCIATTRGWELKAGTAASGNDNTSADAEILVAMGGLSALLGAANLMSVDFEAGTYAHDGSADFDLVYTFDEIVTVTSAAATADNTISNKVHVGVQCLGPTDMANDGAMQLQYYSGSGTNKLTFRGRIPEAAVAGGYIADLNGTYAMATDGSSAVVDGNGTAVTAADADHDGSTPGAGANGSSAIFGTDVLKTGSSVNTLTTTAGSSSGSVAVLTGVVFG